jgi:hypothetical protein
MATAVRAMDIEGESRGLSLSGSPRLESPIGMEPLVERDQDEVPRAKLSLPDEFKLHENEMFLENERAHRIPV